VQHLVYEIQGDIQYRVDVQRWLTMTLGEYIVMRLDEENLELKDLDEDTIDFFYQQWLINPSGEVKHTTL